MLGHDAGEFAVGTILAKVSSPLPLVDGVERHESEAVAATTSESVSVQSDLIEQGGSEGERTVR